MSIRRLSSLVALLACAAATVVVPSRAWGDDDALGPYRDRFRLGMEKYKAGALAEAVRVWSAVYEEIGPKRGYRLSFDLARAYDSNGEATRAAERYRSFLDEVDARTKANELIPGIVAREAADAASRMDALNREHGRIAIAATADAVVAQVDDADPRLGAFTAYVAPGTHVVTFGPGRDDAEKIEVTVAAGEIVVARSTRPPTPRAVPPVDPIFTKRVTHPFSSTVLYASAVATAVSVIAPVLAYEHAYSLIDTNNSTTATAAAKTSAVNAYNGGARTFAYGMLAVPITLGTVTGVLTTWYFAGTKEHEVAASVGFASGGASGFVSGRF